MRHVRRRSLFCMLLLTLALFGLSACASEEDVTVHIQDGQYETILCAAAGESVGGILKKAEIEVHEQDQVTPGLEEVIARDGDTISIERYATVTVQDKDDTETISLTGKKVQDALEELDITLGVNDLVNHGEEAYLTDGMEISVLRRYGVNITVDGQSEDVITTASTVKELLEDQNIRVGEDDRVTPKLKKKLKDDMEIVVQRVTKDQITVTESIAYSTQYENSSSLYTGETKVKQEGKNGSKEVTYEVTYVDGEEESRKEISSKTVEEPVTRIIQQGTKQKQSSSSGSSKSSSGKKEVSREKVYDCDGSGHGYYIIHYSDGSTSYKDF